jgi:hypothetical protein
LCVEEYLYDLCVLCPHIATLLSALDKRAHDDEGLTMGTVEWHEDEQGDYAIDDKGGRWELAYEGTSRGGSFQIITMDHESVLVVNCKIVMVI